MKDYNDLTKRELIDHCEYLEFQLKQFCYICKRYEEKITKEVGKLEFMKFAIKVAKDMIKDDFDSNGFYDQISINDILSGEEGDI